MPTEQLILKKKGRENYRMYLNSVVPTVISSDICLYLIKVGYSPSGDGA